MSTQISHIVLADKIFNKFFVGRSRKEFFIGSIFPDIRILKKISRKETHFDDIKMSEIITNDDFIAGVKCHSLIDLCREEYINNNKVYDLCPESKHKILALKILEEQILYSKISNWEEYIGYLDYILPEEKAFRIDQKNIEKWHQLLQEHLKSQPNKATETTFLLGLGYGVEVIEEINKSINIMASNSKIIAAINSLYDNFESLIYGK